MLHAVQEKIFAMIYAKYKDNYWGVCFIDMSKVIQSFHLFRITVLKPFIIRVPWRS